VSWKNYSLAQAITAISIAATGLVFLGFLLRELECILFGMKNGESPFTMANVHHLRMIALYILLALVLGEIVETVLTGILNCEVNEEALGSILSVIIVYALPFGDYLRAPVKWHHLPARQRQKTRPETDIKRMLAVIPLRACAGWRDRSGAD